MPTATAAQTAVRRRPNSQTAGRNAIHADNPPSEDKEAIIAPTTATPNRRGPTGRVAKAQVQTATPNAVGILSVKGFNQL